MGGSSIVLGLRIALYILSCISGILVTVTLGITKSKVNGQCWLGATARIEGHIYVTAGSMSKCSYSMYMPLTASIFALVVAIIFIMRNNKTDKGFCGCANLAFVPLTLAFSVMLIIASAIITTGFKKLCSEMKNVYIYPCSAMEDMKWRKDYNDTHWTYLLLSIAEVSCWVCAGLWVIQSLVVGLLVWRRGLGTVLQGEEHVEDQGLSRLQEETPSVVT